MKLALTGTQTPMGAALSAELSPPHDIVHLDQVCDVLDPEAVQAALEGVEAVVHAAAHQTPAAGDDAEAQLLDRIGRGTFVLVNAAVAAAVGRLVLISQIGLMAAYPENYVIRPFWQPQPVADAQGLAPYLAELTCREIARKGKIQALCLRMGPLGEAEDGTRAADAGAAVEEALSAAPMEGHSWSVRHVVSAGRFAS